MPPKVRSQVEGLLVSSVSKSRYNLSFMAKAKSSAVQIENLIKARAAYLWP